MPSRKLKIVEASSGACYVYPDVKGDLQYKLVAVFMSRSDARLFIRAKKLAQQLHKQK